MLKMQKGVTLIELMIVVIIISVLSTVAIPSYRGYMVKAHRVDAQSSLLKMAVAQEKYFLENGTYCSNADMAKDLPDGLGIEATSTLGYYEFSVQDALQNLDTGFIITARAIEGQLKDDKDCTVLAINHRGAKYGGPGPVTSTTNNDPKCWNQ